MNKLLFSFFFFCTMSSLVHAQVGVDPHVIGKDGSPVITPSKPDTKYNNRTRNSRQERPSTPGLRDYNEITRDDNNDASINYETEGSVPLETGDTTRIYFFDAEGNPIRDPNKVYRDVGPQSPTTGRRDSVDNGSQPPDAEPEDQDDL